MAGEIRTPLVPKRRMRVGINYTWGYDKYGLYFGPHWRYGEQPREEWMDHWLSDFESNLRFWRTELRVDVVRIFLLCNLQNFGNVGTSGKWEPPPSVDARFFEHFEEMLAASVRAGVQLIPSLLDFGIGAPAINDENRCIVVSDRDARDRLFAQTLVPFLVISGRPQHRATIYAWEIMNEPSWLTGLAWPTPEVTIPPRVRHFDLWEFLKRGVDLVNSHMFPSTVGHRLYSDLFQYPTGTLPQFHYYPSTRSPGRGAESGRIGCAQAAAWVS